MEHILDLSAQLPPICKKYGQEFYYDDAELNAKLMFTPKYEIQNAIKAYIDADSAKPVSFKKF